MSVNSGFATKLMETSYNTLVYNLLYLFQYRIRKFYSNESINESNFRNIVLRSFQKAKKLEKSKFLEPKFSVAVKDLISLMIEMKSPSPDSKIIERDLS